jgi:hypothetical protein
MPNCPPERGQLADDLVMRDGPDCFLPAFPRHAWKDVCLLFSFSFRSVCFSRCRHIDAACDYLRPENRQLGCEVSTLGQTVENQIREIEAAGFHVEKRRRVTETVSGSSAIEQRPGFLKLLDRHRSRRTPGAAA